MGRSEYLDSQLGAPDSRERKSGDPAAVKHEDMKHKAAVKQALTEGKPVPAAVLAEYPDLAPKPVKSKGEKRVVPTPEAAPVEKSKGVKKKAEKPAEATIVPDPGITADVMLASAELEGATAMGRRAKSGNESMPNIIKQLVKTTPEFAYDPTFIVDNDKKLVFRDHHTFRFSPESFNLNPGELTPGMSVGINLPDLGLKRTENQIDVIAAVFKNRRLKVTKGTGKNKDTLTVTAKGMKFKIGRIGEGKGEFWFTSPPKSKAESVVRGELEEVIRGIHWDQEQHKAAVLAKGQAKAEPPVKSKGEKRKKPTTQALRASREEQPLGIGGASGGPRRLNMPAEMEDKTGDRPAIGARDVIETMEREFGVKIVFGRLSNKGVRGIYKKRWMIARGKRDESASVDLAAHEIAHGIDQRTDLVSSLKRGSVERAELKRLDYEPDKGRPAEGFAEFVRGYLTGDIDVEHVAPNFHQQFMLWMVENPKWEKAFSVSKDVVTEFREEGSLKRVKGQLGEVGDKRKSPWLARIKRFANNYYKYWHDQSWYGQLLEKQLRKRGYAPKKGASFIDKYKAFNQGGATLANTALEDGVFTMEGTEVKRLGKGLWEVMKPIGRKEYNDWVAWAYARHAIESWGQNKNPGITRQDAQNVYDEFKGRKGWEEAAQGLTDFNNSLITMSVDVGLLSAEEGKAIIQSYKTYLPLLRIVPEQVTPEGVGGVQLVNISAPVKRRHGSGYKVIDPVQATVKRTIQFYEAAAKQAATNEMISAGKKYGTNGWFEAVPPRQQATRLSLAEIWPAMSEELEAAGMTKEELETLDENGLDLSAIVRIFRPNYRPESGKPEVRVMVNGRPQMFMVHVPELYEMITGMGLFQLPGLLDKTLGIATRATRAGATTLNPTFIATNFFKDMGTYVINRQKGGIVDPAGWVGGYAYSEFQRRTGGKELAYVDLWRKYGGQLSSVLAMDRKSVRRAVKSVVRGRQKFGIMESIMDASQVTEAGPRLAEFVGVWKSHGWDQQRVAAAMEKGTIPRNILIEALNAAHDVTVDFRRAGSWGRWVSRVVPFFNASLQGVDKQFRMYKKETRAATFTRVFAYVILPTIVYWLINHDKDWYKEREDWMNLYFFFDDDDDKPIARMPRGHQASQIGAAVEGLLDWMFLNDPERIKEWLSWGPKELVPPTDVAGAGAFIEVGMNHDFFRDAPIVPRSVQHLEAGAQATKYNTATMKVLGQWMDVSPAKLEHVVNDITGGAYRRVVSPVESWWKDDPLSPSDIPVVQGFVLRSDRTRSVSEFYDEAERLERAYLTAKKKETKFGETAEYQRFTRVRGLVSGLRDVRDKQPPGRDSRFEVERYIVGAARWALGKSDMERYPNPFTAKDLPKEVKEVRDAHLATAASTVARHDDSNPVKPATVRTSKAAAAYLREVGISHDDLAELLLKKMQKTAKKSGRSVKNKIWNRWNRDLRRRLAADD